MLTRFRLIISVFLLLGVAAQAQKNVKLQRKDLLELKQIIKGKNYDGADDDSDVAQLKAINAALKAGNTETALKAVNTADILTLLDRNWYSVEEYRRSTEGYNRFMRILYQLTLEDPAMGFLDNASLSFGYDKANLVILLDEWKKNNKIK